MKEFKQLKAQTCKDPVVWFRLSGRSATSLTSLPAERLFSVAYFGFSRKPY